MLVLALHYLNGWAMAAADGAKKEVAEWPPHPDRVFMALAAAYFETDDGDKAAECASLEWLESLPPPELVVSGHEKRRLVTQFVPVNDPGIAGQKKIAELIQATHPSLGALKDAGLGQLPEFRSRQPRSFPVAIPHDPVLRLIWPDAEPTEHQCQALAGLCRKVTHVGHSASLVSAWLDETRPAPTANLIPGDTIGGVRLRVPSLGRLAYLTARCGRDRTIRWADVNADIADLKRRIKSAVGPAKKTLKTEQARLEQVMIQEFPDGPPVAALDPKLFRPNPGRWQGYGPPVDKSAESFAGSVFDPSLVVLRLSGQRLPLAATAKLMAAFRNTIMVQCPVQPPPAWLSGHEADGNATTRPHLAFLPLPFVDNAHADGRIMGVALALPRDLDPEAAADCLDALLRDEEGQPRVHHLFDGQWFDCTAELETRFPPPQKNLHGQVWSAPSRRWASVTPVVLDRHFDGKDKWEQAADSIKTACTRIGLPRPSEVLLHPISMFVGVPRSSDFPPLNRKSDGGRMHHSHAVLVFDEPVAGPVIIGAGRFRGYGLCRPLAQGGRNE